MTEERGYLFHNDFIIFDEAHTLESVAARHLGLEISHGSLRYLLHRLFHPRTQKGDRRRAAQRRGDEARLAGGGGIGPFLRPAGALARFPARAKELRLREPGLAENTLDLPLARLYRSWPTRRASSRTRSSRPRCRRPRGASRGCASAWASSSTRRATDHVYWVDRQEKRETRLTLTAAPIEVASQLRALIFRPENTAIMTSATLAVGDGLRYFVNRIGGEDAATLQVDSPFDYARQMQVFIPRKMPEPAAREAYEETLGDWIRHFVSRTQGKAFVLFTSYQTMQKQADLLGPFFRSERITCSCRAAPCRATGCCRSSRRTATRSSSAPTRSGRASTCRARR